MFNVGILRHFQMGFHICIRISYSLAFTHVLESEVPACTYLVKMVKCSAGDIGKRMENLKFIEIKERDGEREHMNNSSSFNFV